MADLDIGQIGVVVIGRNEGDRLQRCLRSLVAEVTRIVYVDSGSTDDSVSAARGLGIEVVELDSTRPFTAARARNVGFHRILECWTDCRFVHFLDGDCEIVRGWLRRAYDALLRQEEVAALFGRRRETHPESSIYNRLCDLEWRWNALTGGQTDDFGGDVLIRVKAFQEAGGYDPTLIAGEDPEFSLRLRLAGWKILCIPEDMTLHDAAMSRFAQWWRRSLRAGHAYAERRWIHRRDAPCYLERETRSIWFYGCWLPLVVLLVAWPTKGLSALGLLLYPILMLRILRFALRQGFGFTDARLFAASCVLAKFPHALGQLQFHSSRWTGTRRVVIEYK